MHSTAEEPERAYLVGVQRSGDRDGWRGEASIEELALLARTAGAEVAGCNASETRFAAPGDVCR